MSRWKVIKEQDGEFKLPFGVEGVFVIEVDASKKGKRSRFYIGNVRKDHYDSEDGIQVSELMWKFWRHFNWMKKRQVRSVRWKQSWKKYGGDWIKAEIMLTIWFKKKGRWLNIKETKEIEIADKAREEARFLEEVRGIEEFDELIQQQRRQIN